jgi:hypothetical protein
MTRKALSAAMLLALLCGATILRLVPMRNSPEQRNQVEQTRFTPRTSGSALGAQLSPTGAHRTETQLKAITLYVPPSCDKFVEWTAESNACPSVSTDEVGR